MSRRATASRRGRSRGGAGEDASSQASRGCCDACATPRNPPAFFYSMSGLKAACVHEDGFRQEAILAAVLMPMALFLPASGVGKALMIASVLIVIIVELLNSAVEAAVDRISLENHRLAERAKDLGSAAVFMNLHNVVTVWGLVLFG